MNVKLIKTAAASFAALTAVTGAAFAEDSSTLDNVRNEIAANQDKLFTLVMATSEERVANLQENEDDSEILNLAENDAEPTS